MLETVDWRNLIEMSTIKASILEIEARFKMSERVFNIEPSIGAALADPAGLPPDHGGENQAFKAKVKKLRAGPDCHLLTRPTPLHTSTVVARQNEQVRIYCGLQGFTREGERERHPEGQASAH